MLSEERKKLAPTQGFVEISPANALQPLFAKASFKWYCHGKVEVTYHCPFACRKLQGSVWSSNCSRLALEEHVLSNHLQELRDFSSGSMKMLYAEPRVYNRVETGQPCIVLIPLHSGSSHIADLSQSAKEICAQAAFPSQVPSVRSPSEGHPRKKARTQVPPACHPFFAHLMANPHVPIGKRQGTDVTAIVPWIISDFMLPAWARRHPEAPPVHPPLTAVSFATVLMSRGGGFKSAGKEALYTKKDQGQGLNCVRQLGYLMSKGFGAWRQLMDECCEDWGKVFRHAHPDYVPDYIPAVSDDTGEESGSPACKDRMPNQGPSRVLEPPIRIRLKVSPSSTQRQIVGTPTSAAQAAAGPAATALVSTSHHHRPAAADPSHLGNPTSASLGSQGVPWRRPRTHPSKANAAAPAAGHPAQSGAANGPQSHDPRASAAATGSCVLPEDAAILAELSKCQGQLQQQLHEEAAALEAVRQLEKAQRAAAEAWKTAWNRLEDLQHLKEIHGDLGYMDSYVQTLQPYDHRDDPKLLQPALAAIQALEDGTLKLLNKRLKATPGHEFPDAQAAAAAFGGAQAALQQAEQHKKDLWSQAQDAQILRMRQERARAALQCQMTQLEGLAPHPSSSIAKADE
ncbi:hypothetical protein WJX84_001175 [Apatococcus fuscideae]|uniref:Uncharacterized protein n=1 Tax=Apatococcus fuscideae TaxID=2026836 RepID=A0AAW1T7F2_9CHLO